jgi:hypothetical protein
MKHMDGQYIKEVIERLKRIPDDAKPKWGTLDKAGVIRHLIWVIHHSMGRSKQMPYLGNFITVHLVAPLVLNGFIPIPKNVKAPKHVVAAGATLQDPGDLETLQALLEEYISLVQADELKPSFHPAFGYIGVDGWDKMHVLHFEHHLKQFGV